MADNVTLPGTGAVIATDDAGASGQVQIVKLAQSADGSAAPITANADGLLVNLGANNDVTVSGTVAVSGTVEVANDSGSPLPVSGTVATTAAQTHDVAYVPGTVDMVGGVRRDAETSPVSADGDVHPFVFEETGRLKVSVFPGSQVATTGAITAVAQTVVADVSRTSNVMVYVTGTFAGHNCTFEGSIDGGTSWFGIQAIRTNANTIELTTGVLAAAPAYAWELSVNGLTNMRVRCTAHTSGSANWRIQPSPFATEPIPAAQVSGTQPVSGTVTATGVVGPAAHDAAVSGNPVRLAGRALTANYATVATGDTADLVTSLVGALVVTPYSIPELYWQTTVTLTGTADVALQALLAGNRRCLTSWTLQNTAANVTTVEIKDGTTVIWRCNLPASMAQPQLFQLVNPLRTTAGAALNIAQTNGTTPNVIVNAQGYTAP